MELEVSRHRRTVRAAWLGACVAPLLHGCGIDPAPAPMHFSLSAATRVELAGAPDVVQQIEASLEELFGTPSSQKQSPTSDARDFELSDADRSALRAANAVVFESELDAITRGDFREPAALRRAAYLAPAWRALVATRIEAAPIDADQRDETGAELRELLLGGYPRLSDSAELYRRECLHCHGVEGGGDGPSAAFLDPRPRDFRKGVFKFTALRDQARPRREDLMRTLDQGLPGTAMQSFRRLSSTERQGLVDYVRFLSIRGEVEQQLVATWKEDGEIDGGAARDEYENIWRKWRKAQEKFVDFNGQVPPSTPERVARGKELFHDATKGNCASCHGDDGRGNGFAAYKIGVRGVREPAYLDAWDRPIAPRDLTFGLFRGGSRPIDVYRRIYAGINGGPMPALEEAKNAAGEPLLSSDDLWSLVHYVRSLNERREGP